MRGGHLHVAGLLLGRLHEVDEPLAQRCTLGQPQRKAGAHLLAEGEQVQFLAELAVVALLGFLQQHEVFVQFLLLGEGDGVKAGELLALLIAAPVGPGHAEHLHRFDGRGVRQVRPAAEVGEVALSVEADGAVLEAVDQLQLVFVALLLEVGDGLGLGHFAAGEDFLPRGQLLHLVLDGLEVSVADHLVAQVDVVVKAVLDGRTDPEFGAGIKCFHGFRQQVRATVPHRGLALVVLPSEQLHGAIAGQRAVRFAHLAVHLGGKHVPRQSFADAEGHVHGGGTLLIFPDSSVRQGHIDLHRFAFPAIPRNKRGASLRRCPGMRREGGEGKDGPERTKRPFEALRGEW